MPTVRRRRLAVLAASLLAAPAVHAQTWPSRQIRLIAPYPPGGGVDTVARALAEKLSAKLGQAVVVDNQPGAGATIGGQALARATPDGHTLMLGSIVDYSTAPHFHPNLGFDMAKDFVAIVEIGYGTIAMVVTPDLPARSVAEVIALAKAKPGQLSYASSGVGGLIHLNYEMLRQMTGAEMVHVPYRGTTQLQPDLFAGRVHLSIDNVLAYLPHVATGKVRVLAVASRARSPLLPDVPTMTEAGVPGFESATNYTLFAPRGTPADIVAALNAAGNDAVRQVDFRDRLLKLGIVVDGGTQAAAQAKVAAEMARWATVIKTGGIKPQ